MVLFTILFSFKSVAQLTTIQGNVSNISGTPIGMPVTVTAEVNDFLGNMVVFNSSVDSLGNYSISNIDLDSLLQMVSPVLNVYIIDCNMDTILLSFNGLMPTGTIIQADFDYCPANPNPCNVTASFSYSQNNPVTQTFVPNFAYIINNSIGTGLTYTWDFGDGTTGTGANINHSYAGNGPYALCLTVADTAGCTDTFCDTLTVDTNGVIYKMAPGFILQIGEGSLSTSELEEQVNLTIYPNPAKDQLTISIDLDILDNMSYNLTDISGRQVAQNTIGSKINTIDLSGMAKGTYILNILYGNEVHTEKILIQ